MPRHESMLSDVSNVEMEIDPAADASGPVGPVMERLRWKVRYRGVRFRRTLNGAPFDLLPYSERWCIRKRDLMETATCDDYKYYYDWGPRSKRHFCTTLFDR